MFRPISRVERFSSMGQRKCNSCGKDAFAYLIEADGARIYFCLEHFPTYDAPHSAEEQKPHQDKGAGRHS
jgi:hypothetical protein